MPSQTIRTILVKNLVLNTENPRFEPMSSQREALATMAHDQGMKLVALAEDILDRGTNLSDLPIVTPADGGGLFLVLEGNRRVAALKMLTSRGLADTLGLPSRLARRWKALEDQASPSTLRSITCVEMTEEDAKEWIRLKHTGENEGVGTVTWDGLARHRFRGRSAALQAIDLVAGKGYLDEDTEKLLPKIHITNIERMLVTPDARKRLGVDVQAGELIIVAAEEEALGRLALLVSDVAHRRKKVTDLDTKAQRVAYAQKLAAMELPSRKKPAGGSGKAGAAGKTAGASKGKERPDRKSLIPRKLTLAIPQTRINQMYDELQRLHIDEFTNSGAVLFRVFLELSIDEFARRKQITLKVVPRSRPGRTRAGGSAVRDMTLRQKVAAVANYIERQGIASRQQLQGVRSLASNRNHVLSVDSLNAYVHNQHYNPTPTDLKANWDSVQAFIEAIWA